MSSVKRGDRLRSAREAVGLRQNEAAGMLGMSNSNLSRYEKGGRLPDADILLKLAKLYHVTIDQLVSVDDHDYSFLFHQLSEKDMDGYVTAYREFLMTEAEQRPVGGHIRLILELHNLTEGSYSELGSVQRKLLLDKLFTF